MVGSAGSAMVIGQEMGDVEFLTRVSNRSWPATDPPGRD